MLLIIMLLRCVAVQYGLYTAFIGVFVYAFLGTSRDCSLGPTSVASLMTSQYGVSFIPLDGTVATALCLICGCIELAVGLLRIGNAFNLV